MSASKYRVQLTTDERQELKVLVSRGGRRHTGRLMPAPCCSAMRFKGTRR